MLPKEPITEYADRFFGYGNLSAPIWFIGIEEAGGWREEDVKLRLRAWRDRGCRAVEDAPEFYPASGNKRWHGMSGALQPTWKQLIRMLLVSRGEADTNPALLDYQKLHLGRAWKSISHAATKLKLGYFERLDDLPKGKVWAIRTDDGAGQAAWRALE